MICIRKPSDSQIREYLAQRRETPFPYTYIHGTKEYDTKPEFEADPRFANYDIDYSKIHLGRGRECFERAVAAMKSWKMFDVDWVDFCFNDVPIAVGNTVAVASKQFGFWALNFCRVVYMIDGPDEDESVIRFGFAYGTLDHLEKGEERFTIEWRRDPNSGDGDVFYELLSFSEPQHWMTQLGYPIARFFQEKFKVDSSNAMLKAVGSTERIKNYNENNNNNNVNTNNNICEYNNNN
ncbi:hypothetical protein PPL_07213 [Heterostelium album PN500]|uniref:DUF1990 domain-containing protein n=1 Tax=Heterostelium pallidum (strain ATCC 26659 / Pp 5 / PN500) TaxID=670386 RepID=D3BEP8_HETP5|nr:hypothetical protein PPL_07213 [Heterostelium album PN500]EFA80379.1 hypothetical protein PPL_07213 [Heterostelium album PN500]|eukprot:XP_020432499.1 hypothetical protein PPL_07213 [Heterostelium album PN500]